MSGVWIDYRCRRRGCYRISFLRFRVVEEPRLPVLRDCPYCDGKAKLVDVEEAIANGWVPANTVVETSPLTLGI